MKTIFQSWKRVLMLLSVCILLVPPANAQFQRVGIYMGEELLMEAGQLFGIIPSVCMDLKYASPTRAVKYELTTPNSLQVFVGDSKTPITVNEAVRQGYIKEPVVDDFSGVRIPRGPNAANMSIRLKAVDNTVFNPVSNKIYPRLPAPKFDNSTPAQKALSEYKQIFANDRDLKQSISWHEDYQKTVKNSFEDLQYALQSVKEYSGPVDGSFEHTLKAVKDFNRRHNIPESTPFGAKQYAIITKKNLSSYTAQYATTTSQYEQIFENVDDYVWAYVTPENAQVQYKALQTELKESGYYTGPVNGNFTDTKNALNAFNVRNHLPEHSKFGNAHKNILEKKYQQEYEQIFGQPSTTNGPLTNIIKEQYTYAQERFKLYGLYDGPIDGSYANTKKALQSANKKFNIPAEQPFGEQVENMLSATSEIKSFYEYGYPGSFVSRIGHDENGIDYFIVKNSSYGAEVDNKPAFFKYKTGGEFTAANLEMINISTDLAPVIEKNFAEQVSKINTKEFPVMHIGSINGNNEVQISFNGKTSTYKLNAATPYPDLLAHLKNEMNVSGADNFLLELDPLQRNGFADGLYDDVTITSKKHNLKYINLSRLASDLTTNEKMVMVGCDPAKDLTKFTTLANSYYHNSNSTFLVFDEVTAGMGPKETMLQQCRDKGLNVTKFTDFDQVLDANLAEYNTLITLGHHDEAFRLYLRKLGYNLRGKVLVSYSCKVPGDFAFYADLIKDYGVKLVIHFPDEINPVAVNAVMQKLGTKLDNLTDLQSLHKVWIDAANEAAEDVRYKDIADEIKKLARPGFQVKNDKKKIDQLKFKPILWTTSNTTYLA